MRRWPFSRKIRHLVAPILVAATLLPVASQAASLSAKDVLIIKKVFGFLDPPLIGGVVAVLYDPGNAASQEDATEIATLFGSGLTTSGTLKAEAVPASALGHGGSYAAIILAAGVAGDVLAPVVRASRLLCITADLRQVQAGNCILAVRSEPQVDIVLNRQSAASAGIGFATAFRMLVHEL